jgi:hypothetical protein
MLRRVIRSHIHSGTWALVVVFAILLLQEALSSSMALGQITPNAIDRILRDEIQNQIWQIIKFVIFIPAVLAWLLDRRRALSIWIIVSNCLLSFQLLFSEALLVLTIGDTEKAVSLIRDTLIVAIINILIFSLWYWLIDAPSLKENRANVKYRWDFLFPQRGNQLPGYENWEPHYADFLFLAVVTTMSFSPADTLPLSRRAKFLMGTQAILAFATITILAARALSILK